MIIKDFILEDFRGINLEALDDHSRAIFEIYKETVYQSINEKIYDMQITKNSPFGKKGWEGYPNIFYYRSPHANNSKLRNVHYCTHSIISITLHDDYITADIEVFDNEYSTDLVKAYNEGNLILVPAFRFNFTSEPYKTLFHITSYNYQIVNNNNIERSLCSLNLFSTIVHQISTIFDIDITSTEGYEKMKYMFSVMRKFDECTYSLFGIGRKLIVDCEKR